MVHYGTESMYCQINSTSCAIIQPWKNNLFQTYYVIYNTQTWCQKVSSCLFLSLRRVCAILYPHTVIIYFGIVPSSSISSWVLVVFVDTASNPTSTIGVAKFQSARVSASTLSRLCERPPRSSSCHRQAPHLFHPLHCARPRLRPILSL